MRHEPEDGPTGAPGPLDDALAGDGCVTFVEHETQVRVGWLHAGGEGLIVTARVDEGVVGQTRFWCDAQQWCDWLAPSLPVPSWDALPPAWRASAVALTLATGGAADGGAGDATGDAANAVHDTHDTAHDMHDTHDMHDPASWPRATALTRASVETTWRVGMVLRRDGRELTLLYLDGATAWLRERCEWATPCDALLDPSGLPERRCALLAGWVALSAAQCEQLQVGDAVLLDVAADVASGEYWLVDGDRAIAMRDGRPLDRRVVQLGDAHDGTLGDTASTAVDACASTALLRLEALVAERRFPIPWLIAWRTGGGATSQYAPAECALQVGQITLRCNGAAWAAGRLLRFEDGRIAVRIDARMPTQIACGASTFADPDGDISGGDPMGVHPETT